MKTKIIEVNNCYHCPYAEAGYLVDRCRLLKYDAIIEDDHKNTIKTNCPLEDKE